MRIRPYAVADAAACHAIYDHHARHGLGTFELAAPPLAEMAERLAAPAAAGLPCLVAEADGVLLGFAYASPYRPRIGYRFTAEDSVYVAPDAVGRGVGRALLTALVAACEARPLRRLLAVIGDSGNAASIRLHAVLGFQLAGLLPAVGWKHGRWIDVVLMQRALNGGDLTPPSDGAD